MEQTLTPDRMQIWIYKTCPGGKFLTLTHEQALGQGLTVASWTRDEVYGAKERDEDFGSLVLDAAKDHADSVGEACRFVIAWTTDDINPRMLRSIIHRCQPTEKPDNVFADHADKVSGNATIGQLLSHIAGQQKVINGSIGVILQAYERAMNMQQSLCDKLARRLDALEIPAAAQEDVRVTELKIAGLTKLVEMGPDVAKLALHVFESNITRNASNGASVQ